MRHAGSADVCVGGFSWKLWIAFQSLIGQGPPLAAKLKQIETEIMGEGFEL